jgi:lipid-A-disaccharide synthase
LARDYDVLLSIFPFERRWYARRVPGFRVEFVGHPLMDFYQQYQVQTRSLSPPAGRTCVLLLPGSRPGEITRHLPVMTGALTLLRRTITDLRALLVVPDERLLVQAKAIGLPADVESQIGNLPAALSQAHAAIAKTGTITMDCAFFGLPTVAMYKTSAVTYMVGKQLVRVKYAAMPNLLAGEEIFPEFIQGAATAENIAQATLQLLRDEGRRAEVRLKLSQIVAKLGGPGASRRAAQIIVELIREPQALPI